MLDCHNWNYFTVSKEISFSSFKNVSNKLLTNHMFNLFMNGIWHQIDLEELIYHKTQPNLFENHQY